MPDNFVLHQFPDAFTAGTALADAIVVDLIRAINFRNKATLVVPGGATPDAFLRALFIKEIEWELVTFTLTDERWVSPLSKDSNEGMVQRCRSGKPALDATFIGLRTEAERPEDGVEELSHRLNTALPGLFDVVVLGMGEDGHIASLFHDQINEAPHTPCTSSISQRLPYLRVSLSLQRLLNTEKSYLLCGGTKKHKMLCEETGHPVHVYINQARKPVEVFYFDK